MSDKIYRRATHSSHKSEKVLKKNEKNRKRNVILNFRVTPEEKELIEARIRLSGLSKETFFIESCMYQKIFVKGNIKTFDAIRKSLDSIMDKISNMDYPKEEVGQALLEFRTILELIDNIYKKTRG